MPSSGPADVTRLLLAWREGDGDALERLLPLVYGELHRLAHRRVRGEPAAQTMQTTELVHEAFVRLVDGTQVSWSDRAHFFAVSARLMRRILVDAARARRSEKRGGDVQHVQLQDWIGAQVATDTDLVALDEALARLSESEPRAAKVVELRYFAGLTIEETAAAIEVSRETVVRDWHVAKLWLLHELKRGGRQGQA